MLFISVIELGSSRSVRKSGAALDEPARVEIWPKSPDRQTLPEKVCQTADFDDWSQ
jgi:hypothetical protein